MKPIDKIAELKADIENLFGKDAIYRAIELREKYLEIAKAFQQLREKGVKYEDAIRRITKEFHVSETTAKNAIKFQESLVNNF